MKYNKQNNYKIIFILALLPLAISTNFILTSPINRSELIEIKSSISTDVRYSPNRKNKRLSIYLDGYENEFVINSIVVTNLNTTRIKNSANNFRVIKIKTINPNNRGLGDKLKYYLYDKVDVVELEINNINYLDLESYNSAMSKNDTRSACLFGLFGIILIILGFLERNFRQKINARH